MFKLNSTKFLCDVFNSQFLTYGTHTNPLPFFDFMFLAFNTEILFVKFECTVQYLKA